MQSRLGSRAGITAVQETPRQVKKVSVPVVPDIGTLKCGTRVKDDDSAAFSRGCYQLGSSVRMQQTNNLLETGKYYENCSVCPELNPEAECLGNLNAAASPSSSPCPKQWSLYMTAHNISDDLTCSGCHRNSTGSSSSHGSSSGFESMKSASSRGCSTGGIPRVNSSNSPFISTSSVVCGLPSGMLMRDDSPQLRFSRQSYNSGGASPVSNSSVNMLYNSGTKHINGFIANSVSRLSISGMVLKGTPEAEILAVWLNSLGHPEFLAAFVTQGYDLSTIARITPEDLTALGITQPAHRKLLISEIHKWRIIDSWPAVVPSGELREWLPLIGLPEYVDLFESQGYHTVNEVKSLTWEDFEDIGIKKLGHLKRLGLAVKKMKDYEFGRSQLNNDQHRQQLVTVAVHNDESNVQTVYSDFQPLHAPPPPAPTSSFQSPGADRLHSHYSIWKQNLHPCSGAGDSDMCPEYRSIAASEMVTYCSQGCSEQSPGFDLNERKTKPVQMNLHSPSRILSVEAVQKNDIQRQLSMASTKILSTADILISSDSEDYPPPPAPLACEGSIRLLRSAFHESVMAAVAGSGVQNGSDFEQHYKGTSSFSLNEQIPFANDNCGTIKSREDLSLVPKNNGTSATDCFSQPCTPRRDTHNVLSVDAELSNYSTTTSNGDVLKDIGSMLQNLTDELDAMLLPSKSLRFSPICKQVSFRQRSSSQLQI